MKYNPKVNEDMARLPGFTGLHPLQDQKDIQGALGLMKLSPGSKAAVLHAGHKLNNTHPRTDLHLTNALHLLTLMMTNCFFWF
jgi:hypothetical protein